MQLSQILEEVKIGTETFKKLNKSKKLTESFDKEINTYRVSKLIQEINEGFIEVIPEENISIPRKLKSIQEKIESVEKRIEDNGHISQAYAKMKYDSLSEDYKELNENVKKNKVYRIVDKEKLSQAMALIIFEGRKIAEFGNFDYSQNDFPMNIENFNESVKYELNLLNENHL